MNAYAYVRSNPVNLIDPTGLRYVYLNQSGAVPIGPNPQGHAAFLVGDDASGYTYYSKNGPAGGANFGLYGEPETATPQRFNSLQDFFSDQISHKYTHSAVFETSTLQDSQIANYAETNINSSYNGAFNNCDDLCINSAAAGGLNIPQQTFSFSDAWSSTTGGINAFWNGVSQAVAANTPISVPNQTFNGIVNSQSAITFDNSTFDWSDPVKMNGLPLSSFSTSTQFDVGGVLIDKAAELIGSNLSDIRGATYDPISKQIVFLGSNNGTPSGVNGVNMDYFYTAVQAVYGSAVPPFVTLDPPAGAATPWTDWGDGVLESGETGGFVLRYNPIWSGEDSNIDVRIKAQWSGVKYDMTVHLVAAQMNQPPVIISAGGRYAMKLNYAGAEGLPSGITVNTAMFNNTIPQSLQLSSSGQDSYWGFQLVNSGGSNLIVDSVSVIPDRQHRKFGGRVDGTKLGWVMYEADRVMKCLSVGKDNLADNTSYNKRYGTDSRLRQPAGVDKSFNRLTVGI